MSGTRPEDTGKEQEASVSQGALTWTEAGHFPHNLPGQNSWEVTGTRVSLRKLVLLSPVEHVMEPEVKSGLNTGDRMSLTGNCQVAVTVKSMGGVISHLFSKGDWS